MEMNMTSKQDVVDNLAALSEAALAASRTTGIVERLRTREAFRAALVEAYRANQLAVIGPDAMERKFAIGDRVTKTKGSKWTGRVVGFYSTDLTPEGYAVESENEPGSVQIYPAAAIAALTEGV